MRFFMFAYARMLLRVTFAYALHELYAYGAALREVDN